MKVLIICSKQFYSKIEEINEILKNRNIDVFLPNCYDDPSTEERMWNLGKKEHQEFKAKMFQQSEDTIKNMDAVLVLNYDKNKNGKAEEISEGDTNYLGACTKGANANSLREQPFSDVKAMQRAFCLKNSYMSYILNHYIANKTNTAHIWTNSK